MKANTVTNRPRPRVAILIVNGFLRRTPLQWTRRRHNADQARKYPWIELCLSQIDRFSKGWPYEVFVFDNSHLKLHRRLMRKHPNVRVIPGNWFAVLGRAANRMPVRHINRLFELSHPRARTPRRGRTARVASRRHRPPRPRRARVRGHDGFHRV